MNSHLTSVNETITSSYMTWRQRDSELVQQIARLLTGTVAALLDDDDDDDDEAIKWMSSVLTRDGDSPTPQAACCSAGPPSHEEIPPGDQAECSLVQLEVMHSCSAVLGEVADAHLATSSFQDPISPLQLLQPK
ncbi:hypothetical protein TURU_087743 [Turdus rufiventris]|nr:hypothetical protein TURU_087743 [Turdus rufiventris]